MTDRTKITDGPNERSVEESIAGTGPGIPDEAATPGVERPDPPSDDDVKRAAKQLGAHVPEKDE